MSKPLNISIEGLSQEAVDMLDCLYNCETQGELADFKACLNERELKLSETCEELLVLAVRDSMLENMTDFTGSEAEEVINKVKFR